MPAPTGEEVADLTITIRRSDRLGWIDWTFDTPHLDVAKPTDAPTPKEIGDPVEFLRSQVRQISDAEERAAGGIYGDVLGLARTVGASVPAEIWTAIHAVGAKVGAPPTILLVSEEPYVPWELAFVAEPIVPGQVAPPFLAAQTRIGRWVQATEQGAGRWRPSPNPPRKKDVTTLGVVWGDYSATEWSNLDHAAKEAATLKKRYGADTIKATGEAMFNLLAGDPRPDLLHFAVHGRYDPTDAGGDSGIILVDEGVLHDTEILARDLDAAPVVFLNACQVGAGRRALDTYAGVAAAFVTAGASAVVAPLWSVDDEIAGRIAVDFYEQAAKGEALSEVLRMSRQAFVDRFDTKSATWMAYQLFGHPSFVISGLKKP